MINSTADFVSQIIISDFYNWLGNLFFIRCSCYLNKNDMQYYRTEFKIWTIVRFYNMGFF